MYHSRLNVVERRGRSCECKKSFQIIKILKNLCLGEAWRLCRGEEQGRQMDQITDIVSLYTTQASKPHTSKPIKTMQRQPY